MLQSMANSKIVEISSDRMRMRAREEPAKWSLRGIEPTTFSSLSVNVPEFVPGKLFKAPDAGISPMDLAQSPGNDVTDKAITCDGNNEIVAPVGSSEDTAQIVKDDTLSDAVKETGE
jgi:hypothetical protein